MASTREEKQVNESDNDIRIDNEINQGEEIDQDNRESTSAALLQLASSRAYSSASPPSNDAERNIRIDNNEASSTKEIIDAGYGKAESQLSGDTSHHPTESEPTKNFPTAAASTIVVGCRTNEIETVVGKEDIGSPPAPKKRKTNQRGSDTRKAYPIFTKLSLCRQFREEHRNNDKTSNATTSSKKISDARKQRHFLEKLKTYPLSILQLHYGMEDASDIPPPPTFKKWLLDPALSGFADSKDTANVIKFRKKFVGGEDNTSETEQTQKEFASTDQTSGKDDHDHSMLYLDPRKRNRTGYYPDVSALLLDYIHVTGEKRPQRLREQALAIYDLLYGDSTDGKKNGMDDDGGENSHCKPVEESDSQQKEKPFKASYNWIQNVLERHRLQEVARSHSTTKEGVTKNKEGVQSDNRFNSATHLDLKNFAGSRHNDEFSNNMDGHNLHFNNQHLQHQLQLSHMHPNPTTTLQPFHPHNHDCCLMTNPVFAQRGMAPLQLIATSKPHIADTNLQNSNPPKMTKMTWPSAFEHLQALQEFAEQKDSSILKQSLAQVGLVMTRLRQTYGKNSKGHREGDNHFEYQQQEDSHQEFDQYRQLATTTHAHEYEKEQGWNQHEHHPIVGHLKANGEQLVVQHLEEQRGNNMDHHDLKNHYDYG